MKKIKTKMNISISIDKNILKYLNDNISNKSKYIEWVIYQDFIKKNLLKKELYIVYDNK